MVATERPRRWSSAAWAARRSRMSRFVAGAGRVSPLQAEEASGGADVHRPGGFLQGVPFKVARGDGVEVAAGVAVGIGVAVGHESTRMRPRGPIRQCQLGRTWRRKRRTTARMAGTAQ